MSGMPISKTKLLLPLPALLDINIIVTRTFATYSSLTDNVSFIKVQTMKVAILGASGTTGRSIVDGLLSSSEVKFVRYSSPLQMIFICNPIWKCDNY